MTFTVASKSQLAKLLATENLTIEHQKISTAKFDPKNRVLYCPIWKDMSSSLYDLLMGHEVGHALYTPAEGWHDAVSNKGKNFKGFLNVVEDARIEKKVKRRYPGIRKSFVEGYANLLDRDFFGIKNKDVNKLSFVDRLNIYTKSSGLTKIKFTDEEMVMVKQVEACETWDDVLRVTETVFDYSKNEQFETMQISMASIQIDTDYEFDEESEMDMDGEFSDYDDYSDEDSEAGDQNIGEKRDTDSKGESGKEVGESEDGEGKDGTESEKDIGNKINSHKDSKASERDQFVPTCETDNAFRQNEFSLLDEKCKPFVYATLPEPILDNIVTPYKVVHNALESAWQIGDYAIERAEKVVKDFKNKNDRYVGLLAKEFEMKKAARAYAKAKVSNTGDIDISRLYRYQVDDNIFRKTMRVPKGKSHGLVLLLDRSGSMSRNMAGSIEQILVLALFCRKVNIPFVVYGFGDSTEGRRADYPNELTTKRSFTRNENEVAMDTVYLREYINSRLSNAEFNRCIKNLVVLKESYAGRTFRRPANEHLSNTPLNQALVALAPLTNQFRKVNNLDLVNMVIVHDGDADNVNAYYSNRQDYKGDMAIMPTSMEITSTNVYIKDRNSKLQVRVPDVKVSGWYNDGMRVAMFDWYRSVTGAKIFGFFIAGEGRELRQQLVNKYVNKDGLSIRQLVENRLVGIDPEAAKWQLRYIQYDRDDMVKDLAAKVRSEKFVQSYNEGYDAFFIMPGGSELAVENEELQVEGKVTASKLKNAFMKMNKKKQVSRVMVSRFIDGIAA